MSTDDNPLGGTIADTYLTDNDEINVYFDNLYSESLACECNKIFSVDYDSSTNKTTVNVKSAMIGLHLLLMHGILKTLKM